MNYEKKWVVAEPPTPEETIQLSSYPSILQTLLYRRGCKTPEEARTFLEALQPTGTINVWPLGIEPALDRIHRAVKGNERVIVYGDYDVDGITATAVLVEILEKMGCDARPFIPHRIDDGYGLQANQFHFFRMIHTNLIITVDCGIRSLEDAKKAKEMGLDLIITDHHPPGPELPDALAIINPMQAGDPYPEKYLAGVGLAYKLAHALANSNRPPIKPDVLLDLVALGTVADMSPLLGENRYLVKRGLNRLHQTARVGIRALADVAHVDLNTITANDIGFTLGPRLNAAGRLGSGSFSLNLLMAKDASDAREKANELNKLNRERQKLTQDAVWDARARANPDDPVIFVFNPDYNPGIIGLIAARLSGMFYKPAVVVCSVDGHARGSCRSIPEYHITNALDRNAALLESHGGHAAAAGFSVKVENIPKLSISLNEDAQSALSGMTLEPKIYADMEIQLKDLDREFLEALSWLEPYGQENPKPVFVSRNLHVLYPKTVGTDGAHLVMRLSDGEEEFEAIAFRQGHWIENMPEKIDVIYTINCTHDTNHVIDRVQLVVEDLKRTK